MEWNGGMTTPCPDLNKYRPTYPQGSSKTCNVSAACIILREPQPGATLWLARLGSRLALVSAIALCIEGCGLSHWLATPFNRHNLVLMTTYSSQPNA